MPPFTTLATLATPTSVIRVLLPAVAIGEGLKLLIELSNIVMLMSATQMLPYCVNKPLITLIGITDKHAIITCYVQL